MKEKNISKYVNENQPEEITNNLSFINDIPKEVVELLWFENGPYKNYSLTSQDKVDIGEMMQHFKHSFGAGEPSSINLLLPISECSIELALEKPCPEFYSTPYRELNPNQRYLYLKWLSDFSIPIDISYVFIFYYGLERHLVLDDENKKQKAINMIINLWSKFKTNKSFESYVCNTLLQYFIQQKDYKQIENIINIISSQLNEFGPNLTDYKIMLYNRIDIQDIKYCQNFLTKAARTIIERLPEGWEQKLEQFFIKKYGTPYIPIPVDYTKNIKPSYLKAYANLSIRDKAKTTPIYAFHSANSIMKIPSLDIRTFALNTSLVLSKNKTKEEEKAQIITSAENWLSIISSSNLIKPIELRDCIKSLTQAAKLGHIPSMEFLAKPYSNIYTNGKNDMFTAIEFFEKLEDIHRGEDYYNLGCICYDIYKASNSRVYFKKAVLFLTKAINKGYIPANIELAKIQSKLQFKDVDDVGNVHSSHNSLRTAYICYSNAALKRDLNGLNFQAISLIYGLGCEQNKVKGFSSFYNTVKSQQVNNSPKFEPIWYNLAYCYENGIGTEKSLNKAFEYYNAIQDISNMAKKKLAFFYENGIVVEKNLSKALYYYKEYIEAEQTGIDLAYLRVNYLDLYFKDN